MSSFAKERISFSIIVFAIAAIFPPPGSPIAVLPRAATSLAIDSSSPQSLTGTGNLTTATFSPPANSVIVVTGMSDEVSTQTFAVTDNLGTHLTYHNVGSGPYGSTSNDGRVQAWWATNATAAPMSITLTPSQFDMQMQLRVLVFTGADTANPIGAVCGGRGISSNLSQTYTSTLNNSWGWAIYADWNQKGVPTLPANEALDSTYNPAGLFSTAVIKQNSVTSMAGTQVTMSTLTPSSGTQITWMYYEMLPANSSAGAQAATECAPTNLTVNAAVTYQTMNGVGSNLSSWSWKNGELRPALDALIDTLGHNIFRVNHDRMEWAGTGSTRPTAILTNLQKLDPITLQSVYEVPDMQDLWNTVGYLNSKGVTDDQIIVNFMGWTAPWMGGSGAYGSVSRITNNAQTNQDIATMIASLVYYGHHRRDVSGANRNLSFGYIAPLNETDWNGLEGPLVSASQMNTIYENIITTLSAMGDTTTKLMGPDTASSPDGYTSAFSAAVRARMTHFSWHNYGGSPVSPATSRSGMNADWMTETSKWCTGCDNNQPPGESEWSFGSGIGDILLGDIENGFSSVLSWEGYDAYYYHHDSFSAWGHVGCTQNGGGCTASDAYPRVYTIRGRAWPEATIAKAISPGMVMRGLTTTLPNLIALSFYNPTTGRFSIVGHNTGSSQITINGQLQNLPDASSLALYETNASLNLQRMNDVALVGNLFTATIPVDTFFYFTNTNNRHQVFVPFLMRSFGATRNPR